ncbi:MAG: UDP-N-acetylmuramate--L-alanine ligase [Synergistaceae bacterium]|nr:UDP-N-acetylmuramate--L-alanine ligase [Synergistaceae bacterium]
MNSEFRGIKRVHLMGIGGAGVSGLALLLKGLGFEVSGCDLVETSYLEKLVDIPVKIGHDSSHIIEFSPDLVIYSSAIPDDNPELMAAKDSPSIRVKSRGDVLSWIFNSKFGVGIAGAHGKTTTSSMISFVLVESGLAPTIAIGGEVIDVGINAILGKSDIMVAELDESDGSFEKFSPDITIVTNVDWDHVDKYHTFKELEEAFIRFVKGARADGSLVVCADDDGGAKLIEALRSADPDRKIITYGWGINWDWSAADVVFYERGGVTYSLYRKGSFICKVNLKLPGEHNVLNSLAACAAVSFLGIAPEKFAEIISNFSGAKRRFQLIGKTGKFIIYDDYAHHPAEIKATIYSARNCYPNHKITVVFQPHRYTRTKLLYKEIAGALSLADRVFLLPIYSADEPAIEGVSSEIIANALNDDIIQNVKVYFSVCSNWEELFEILDQTMEEELLLTLGAGDVTEIGMAYILSHN